MQILKTTIKPGKTILYLDIAKLHTGTSIEVPIIIEKSNLEGPTVLITAGLHGDEVNGVEIVRQIIAKKYNVPDCGTVICIPVINVFGFLNQDRKFPDGRDLNRVFPGNKNGSLAARYAKKILDEIIPDVDFVLDFHTGGGNRFNYSQIRIDTNQESDLALAKVFGCKFILHSKLMDKTFRKSLIKLGKKVLLFEGGKNLHLDKEVTKAGIGGALRVMQSLGVRNFNGVLTQFPRAESTIFVKSSFWVRAHYSGLFRRTKTLGDLVKKGDVIGSISDPYGDFEKFVKSPYNGYIICATHQPIVNQGDALIHISNNHELLV